MRRQPIRARHELRVQTHVPVARAAEQPAASAPASLMVRRDAQAWRNAAGSLRSAPLWPSATGAAIAGRAGTLYLPEISPASDDLQKPRAGPGAGRLTLVEIVHRGSAAGRAADRVWAPAVCTKHTIWRWAATTSSCLSRLLQPRESRTLRRPSRQRP
jgi:hypothetical protein